MSLPPAPPAPPSSPQLGARATVVNRRPGRWWRVLQFLPVRMVLAVLAIALVVAAVQGAAAALHVVPLGAARRLLGLLMVAGVCGAYAAYVRLIERRRVVELAWRDGLPELAKGAAVGGALFCGVILALWAMGDYRVTGVNGAGTLVGPFLGALIAGFVEELVFRGVVFRLLEEGLGSWLALAISAAVFGLLHAFNPGATPASTLAIACEAGILLGAVYMVSRRLWTSIGLHVAWNFAEGGVFGASVSGGKAGGLLAGRFQGADLWTGGKFGPEASLVAVLLCVAAGLAYLWLARRRGQVVPFRSPAGTR